MISISYRPEIKFGFGGLEVLEDGAFKGPAKARRGVRVGIGVGVWVGVGGCLLPENTRSFHTDSVRLFSKSTRGTR